MIKYHLGSNSIERVKTFSSKNSYRTNEYRNFQLRIDSSK